MEEVCIKIPEELRREIEESNIDLSMLLREAIASKIFEKQLSKSLALQRALFEALTSKSKLTEEDAKELADKVNMGMLEEIKDRFPNL